MTGALTFEPSEIRIRKGDTVIWTNRSAIPHTATCDPAQNPLRVTQPDLIRLPAGAEPFGSELLQEGATFSHTFTVPGEYAYICKPHVLSAMRGKITVTSCG